MADFKKAIGMILKHEGGYVFDPDDPGGETNYGISKKSYPDTDIKNLTVDDAKEIYKRDFWDKIRLDEITKQNIASKLFDMAVNMGRSRAVKIVQDAVSKYSHEIAVDGIIGSQTIGAINSVKHSPAFLKLIVSLRIMRYIEIIEKRPASKKYLAGWLIRA